MYFWISTAVYPLVWLLSPQTVRLLLLGLTILGGVLWLFWGGKRRKDKRALYHGFAVPPSPVKGEGLSVRLSKLLRSWATANVRSLTGSRGLMLVGEPGTAKTMLSESAASAASSAA